MIQMLWLALSMHCDYIWSLTLCTQGHRWHSKQHLSTSICGQSCAQETSYYTPLARWVQAFPAVTALCMSDMHQRPATGADFTAGSNAMWLYSPGTMLDHSKSNTRCSFFAPHYLAISHPELQETEELLLLLSPTHALYTSCMLLTSTRRRKKLSQLQAPNSVLNGCAVIMYLRFSSGFGGGVNLPRLLAEKQVTPWFVSALG